MLIPNHKGTSTALLGQQHLWVGCFLVSLANSTVQHRSNALGPTQHRRR